MGPAAAWPGAMLDKLFAVVTVQGGGDEGLIVGANSLMCALSGYSEGELIGKTLDMLVPQESREAHRFYRQGFMLRPSTRLMGPDREVLLAHREGHNIRVWVGLSPIGDDHVMAVVLPMDSAPPFGPRARV